MNAGRLALLVLVAAAIGAFFALDLGRWLTLEALKEQHETLLAFYEANRALAIALYALIYVAAASLSVPGAALLNIAGGALFGFWIGLVAASFASSVGALLAMLVARFLLRDFVQVRFAERLATVNAGIERDGAFYLFALRLLPIFPYFMINLVMGLTQMRAFTYYWVSQLGMLAAIAVYVNLGTQLAQVETLSGALSMELLASLALLGVLPLAARKAVVALRARGLDRRWARRPARID